MNRKLLLMFAAVLLAGCSADPDASSRREAADQFDAAAAHLANARKGFIADEAFGKSLEAYRPQQFDQAAEALTPLMTRGSRAQQAAAAQALAQARAGQARLLAREATAAWSRSASLPEGLLSTLSAARQPYARARVSRQLDANPDIQQARRQLDQAEQTRDRLQGLIRETERQIEQMTERMEQLKQQRSQTASEAAALRNRAFDASGQMRYDLQVRAAELSREADQYAAEADKLDARIAVARSRLSVLRTELAQVEEKIQAIEATIRGARERAGARVEQADEAEAQARQLAEALVESLTSRSQRFEQEVVTPMDQARDHLREAVTALETAVAKAERTRRPTVQFDLAAQRAELAHLLRQKALMLRDHAEMLQLMADQADAGFPAEPAQQIRSMADAASEAAEQVSGSATEAFGAAAETLSEAADAAREEAMTVAALRQLVDIYDAHAAMTGSMELRQQADQARQRLEEVRGS